MVFTTSVVVVVFVLCVVGWSAQHTKHITIVIGHEVRVVQTVAQTGRALFDEIGIDVLETDRVSKPLHEQLDDRDTIVITRTFPIAVRIGARKEVVYVPHMNVRDVLWQERIVLGPKDRISKPLVAAVLPYDTIDIVRVRTVAKTQRVVRAYETQRVYDATMAEGTELVKQKGREGIVVQTMLDWYENDRFVRTTALSSVVKKQHRDRIVAIGTKRPTPKRTPRVTLAGAPAKKQAAFIDIDGARVPVVDVLKDVSLSAYTAHRESTGKSPDHPAYGITKSGERVQEGRTIAVDPDVIPLGWWVYIDGIGVRRAEDTGHHIDGSDIDVYVRHVDDAKAFGRKDGHTVYVLGPTLPKRMKEDADK